MFWVAVFLAWSIWAHFGDVGIKLVGMAGAMILLGVALVDFLNTFWKVKPSVVETTPPRDHWNRPVRRVASHGKGFLPSSDTASAIPSTSWLARATMRPPRRYSSLTSLEPS